MEVSFCDAWQSPRGDEAGGRGQSGDYRSGPAGDASDGGRPRAVARPAWERFPDTAAATGLTLLWQMECQISCGPVRLAWLTRTFNDVKLTGAV
ncbi:hypothetical protein GCM10010495_47630 [Kitasatospora herbaricolor]|nr:hypothetical protein GCM10010495_47630 [Kitasatospora herbaricolor]